MFHSWFYGIFLSHIELADLNETFRLCPGIVHFTSSFFFHSQSFWRKDLFHSINALSLNIRSARFFYIPNPYIAAPNYFQTMKKRPAITSTEYENIKFKTILHTTTPKFFLHKSAFPYSFSMWNRRERKSLTQHRVKRKKNHQLTAKFSSQRRDWIAVGGYWLKHVVHRNVC